MKDSDLQRLLRAAAETVSDQPDEMPFGFDTRILADWRAGLARDFVDVGRLLRRVVLLSLAVIALASVGSGRSAARSVASVRPLAFAVARPRSSSAIWASERRWRHAVLVASSAPRHAAGPSSGVRRGPSCGRAK